MSLAIIKPHVTSLAIIKPHVTSQITHEASLLTMFRQIMSFSFILLLFIYLEQFTYLIVIYLGYLLPNSFLNKCIYVLKVNSFVSSINFVRIYTYIFLLCLGFL